MSGVQDFVTTPALRQVMVSTTARRSTWRSRCEAPAGSPESSQAYQRVSHIVTQTTAGTDLVAHVTGQAAIIGDMSIVSARDMHLIEIATAMLVLVILLVIYRRPVTVLLPLLTIGDFGGAGPRRGVRADQVGLSISALTIVLMTAMIVGAGTDYAVFLISRYHEYLRDRRGIRRWRCSRRWGRSARSSPPRRPRSPSRSSA